MQCCLYRDLFMIKYLFLKVRYVRIKIFNTKYFKDINGYLKDFIFVIDTWKLTICLCELILRPPRGSWDNNKGPGL